MSDGPQRKTTEESESLRYAGGIPRWPTCTDRNWREAVGIVEMVEAITGRKCRGTSGSPPDIEMETLFKFGEKNKST